MSDVLPLQFRIHKGIEEIPEKSWNGLLDDEALPFLEWAWLEALEASGSISPDRGWHPRHLTLWRGNRLVAAAPAYLKDDSHGEFVFDWSWASAAERVGLRYYPKLILAVPATPATGRRILVSKQENRASCESEELWTSLDPRVSHRSMRFFQPRRNGRPSRRLGSPVGWACNTTGETPLPIVISTTSSIGLRPSGVISSSASEGPPSSKASQYGRSGAISLRRSNRI